MQAHKVKTAMLMRRERGEYQGGTELMSPAPGGALQEGHARDMQGNIQRTLPPITNREMAG